MENNNFNSKPDEKKIVELKKKIVVILLVIFIVVLAVSIFSIFSKKPVINVKAATLSSGWQEKQMKIHTFNDNTKYAGTTIANPINSNMVARFYTSTNGKESTYNGHPAYSAKTSLKFYIFPDGAGTFVNSDPMEIRYLSKDSNKVVDASHMGGSSNRTKMK